MMEFMVIAAPRSGTTWAANWLTTDTTLCLHDPLFTLHYTELDAYPTKKNFGISCTGIAVFTDWVNAHPARKVILHRDLTHVNQSLSRIGLPPIEKTYIDKLDTIDGMHCDWMDLFVNPRAIYEHLTQLPFDPERHALLKDIEMQPQFAGLNVRRDVTASLFNEMRAIGV